MADVVLVYDSEAHAGLGHRRRLESLASELRRRGLDVLLQAAGGRVVASALVIDSYRTRADDRDLYDAAVISAIDDLARDLDVDVVVDPSPGADAAAHRRTRLALAGADYALIDPELRRFESLGVSDRVRGVLVTTGAADRRSVGARIARAIANEAPPYEIRLVVGPWGSQEVPAGVTPVRTTTGLAAELARADIVVTAGGVTLLETLALGRPAVCLAIADNQRRSVDHVTGVGGAILATPDSAAREVAALTGSEARRRLSERARAVVDGRGAGRVADALVATLGASRTSPGPRT